MEFITFLRVEPVMGWFLFLAIMLLLVPVASVLWRRMKGHNPDLTAKPPLPATKTTSFGNQIDLLVLFIGLVVAVAIDSVIRSIFFGGG